jgi:diamine N-acetyltransferase
MQPSSCKLVPLDRYNWELCLRIQIKDAQKAFVPSIEYSLAQAFFEKLTPYGLMYDTQMVGFLMYGQFGGVCWINRIVIDHRFQGKGLGKVALDQLIHQLRRKMSCREIRTSYAKDNTVAAQLFRSAGFRPIHDEPVEDEIVMRLG